MLFIGFQAQGTRGAAIKSGATTVKIFGEEVPVRAQVAALEEFSDHADTPELLEWLRTFKKQPRNTFLVHGDTDASAQLRDTLDKELKWNVQVAQWLRKLQRARSVRRPYGEPGARGGGVGDDARALRW